MNVLWPWALVLLALIPLVVALYIWMLRRKRRYAVRFSNLALVRAAMPRYTRWRRHLPFALFVSGLAGLLLGMARPALELTVPMNRTTIILAMDVSRSMCSTDVEPNRLAVAQQAALAFIEDQPQGTQIGIVAFTGLAEIVVLPTSDKEALAEAVNGFTTAIGTAIGSAILKSIDAIAEVNGAVAPSGVNLRAGLDQDGGAQGDFRPQEAPVAYQPDIIVLLTDGANSRGPDPVDAAQQAVDRQVRIYTIGFGTTNPGPMSCTREQLGGDLFGRGGGFPGGFGDGSGGGDSRGFRRFVMLDEPALRQVAEMTGGAYFEAESAEQLLEVFRDLPSHIVLQTEEREISVLFSALALALVATGVILSLRWNRFP